MQIKNLQRATVLALAVLAAGCTAVTKISTTQAGGRVTIEKSTDSAAPRVETIAATSFGNYDFKAEAPGLDPFYGMLPLKFNGGYLALDILFFAPAAFYNLREVYPEYEFDVEKKHVKYRKSSADEWSIYVPLDPAAAHTPNSLKTRE